MRNTFLLVTVLFTLAVDLGCSALEITRIPRDYEIASLPGTDDPIPGQTDARQQAATAAFVRNPAVSVSRHPSRVEHVGSGPYGTTRLASFRPSLFDQVTATPDRGAGNSLSPPASLSPSSVHQAKAKAQDDSFAQSLAALDFRHSLHLASFFQEPVGPTGGESPVVEDDPDEGGISDDEMAAMAEKMNNPLGNLWMISMQYDIGQWEGDIVRAGDRKTNSTFYLQPVLPFRLTEEWSVIARPTFLISSITAPSGFDVIEGEGEPQFVPGSFDRETGLGDTILPLWFSARTKPPFVIGAGPTFMFPTASDDILGTGKWSAGPSALALYLGDEFIVGGIMQHWWDYASKSGRRDQVNLTNFQFIYRYRVTPTTNIGGTPNIIYNWDTDEATIPLGIGADTIVKIGPLPMKIGAEFQYFPAQPDLYGPEWQIRFVFVPIIPAPAFAKNPLFGG